MKTVIIHESVIFNLTSIKHLYINLEIHALDKYLLSTLPYKQFSTSGIGKLYIKAI